MEQRRRTVPRIGHACSAFKRTRRFRWEWRRLLVLGPSTARKYFMRSDGMDIWPVRRSSLQLHGQQQQRTKPFPTPQNPNLSLPLPLHRMNDNEESDEWYRRHGWMVMLKWMNEHHAVFITSKNNKITGIFRVNFTVGILPFGKCVISYRKHVSAESNQ